MSTTEKERLWARRMTEWERSGTSRRTWCAANEVSIHTFDYWRHRLRTRVVVKRSARQKLVPMVVKSAPSIATSSSTVEIAPARGIALRTPVMADVRWLAALVREIEAC